MNEKVIDCPQTFENHKVSKFVFIELILLH
jgi:hypothetical protein